MAEPPAHDDATDGSSGALVSSRPARLAPFEPLPYEALGERPWRPHRFDALPTQRIPTWTEALGDIATTVRITGSGPPLLLLHGLMTTGYSWRYVTEALSQHHTLYIPDLPGAGDTPPPSRGRLRPEAVADWLHALLDALGLSTVDVVGNSMGGYLAMWFALRHPASVGRVVNVHGPGLPTARLFALWLAMRLPGSTALLRRLVDRTGPRRWAHTHVHYADETLKSLEEARVYGDPLATPQGLEGFAAQLRDMMDWRDLVDFRRRLRAREQAGLAFPVPLMLLYAREDPMVPPRIGRALHTLLPEARMVWVRHASHFMQVDAPERFLHHTLGFLGDR